LSADLIGDLMSLFGVELVLRVNRDLEAKMTRRYERRDERRVRSQKRVSKKLMGLALSQFSRRLSKIGNNARRAKLPPEARSNIARAAALSRWQRHRATVNAAAVSGCKHERDRAGAGMVSTLLRAWCFSAKTRRCRSSRRRSPTNVHSIEAARTRRATELMMRGREVRVKHHTPAVPAKVKVALDLLFNDPSADLASAAAAVGMPTNRLRDQLKLPHVRRYATQERGAFIDACAPAIRQP
jgi:hypothetical protein